MYPFKKAVRNAVGMLCLGALLSVCLTACNQTSDPLYYRYNYDLSEYITLGEYNGIPAVYTSAEITDETVELEIQSTLAYYASEEEIDDGASFGNIVYFSSIASLDGEKIDDYCEEEAKLTLGFSNYGEEIDNVLTGAKAGDVVSSTRTLPDEAIYDVYAGCTLEYTITVQKVCKSVTPQLSDLFVQAYLDFDSVEEYRTAVREALTEQVNSARTPLILKQVWETLTEQAVVLKYPEKELEEIYDQVEMELDQYIESIGITRTDYIEAVYGMTEEEYTARIEELAKNTVKEEMIIYSIARAENIQITDEQYDTFALYYAQNYGYSTIEEVEDAFGKDVVRAGVLADVTKEWLVDHAAVSEN